MKKKLAGLFVLILLAFVFLVIGITIINAKSGDKYTKQVLAQSQQQYDSTTIPYKREIFWTEAEISWLPA